MDKQKLDRRISEAARSILQYCKARTRNSSEAEDLAQDIVLELYRSVPNLRDDQAFYGFMWSVAANVYKQWLKQKKKIQTCSLEENILAEESFPEEDREELYLLRRELGLLVRKYRKATILYYIEGLSCSKIADALSISESMVKYLLFKSRQILKEGLKMERNYGTQSYDPKELQLKFWGYSMPETFYHICDSKIAQNILFACYNDTLRAEQISLEIGVPLPYMEDQLEQLHEYER